MLATLHGTIRHRLLVNYAADPEVVAGLLPAPFRPQIIEGPRIAFTTADGLRLDATAQPSTGWSSALFPTAEEASDLFVAGRGGFSHDHRGRVEGIDMAGSGVGAVPVDLTAHSTYFDEVLPAGSAQLDCGLLMRDLPVTWSRLDPPGDDGRSG